MPTHEEIAACAFEIWRLEGEPEGRAEEHWNQAETQLLAAWAHSGWTESDSGVNPEPVPPAIDPSSRQ